MTPELWQAKKVVDSTLHPGVTSFLKPRIMLPTTSDLLRYRETGFSSLPHVMLCHIKSRRYRWNAHAWPTGTAFEAVE